jgi:hypothetical protein
MFRIREGAVLLPFLRRSALVNQARDVLEVSLLGGYRILRARLSNMRGCDYFVLRNDVDERYTSTSPRRQRNVERW